MEIVFPACIFCLLLQAPVRPASGPDFNGTWTLKGLSAMAHPLIKAIGEDLARAEKILVVEQTASEIRVSRRGTTEDGRPIVRDSNYSLLSGNKGSASLHGSSLTIKRQVEALLGETTDKMDGEEEWSFRDGKETLQIVLYVRSPKITFHGYSGPLHCGFWMDYKRAPNNKEKMQRK
jgi:hypothetical protein